MSSYAVSHASADSCPIDVGHSQVQTTAKNEAQAQLPWAMELGQAVCPELGISLLDVPNMMMILAGIGPL